MPSIVPAGSWFEENQEVVAEINQRLTAELKPVNDWEVLTIEMLAKVRLQLDCCHKIREFLQVAYLVRVCPDNDPEFAEYAAAAAKWSGTPATLTSLDRYQTRLGKRYFDILEQIYARRESRLVRVPKTRKSPPKSRA